MRDEFVYALDQVGSPTPTISIIKVKPTKANRCIYRSGQYVEARLSDNILLPLSIANRSSPDGHLEFHLRHNETQPLAQRLLQEIMARQKIFFRGPFGSATLDRAQGKKRLFLAGGTGFAPIKALLEEVLYEEKAQAPVKLYWGVRRPEDVYQKKLIKTWQEKFAHFSFTVVLSGSEEFPRWRGAKGLVHEYLVQSYPYLKDCYVFASGPLPMIMATKVLFAKQSLGTCRLISDMVNASCP